VSVLKKKNTFGLENMIEVPTNKEVFKFTSYVFRDQALEIIEQTLTAIHPGHARAYKDKRSFSSSLGDVLDLDIQEEDNQHNGRAEAKMKKKKQREREFQKRNKTIIEHMIPLNKYEQLAFKFDYEIDYNIFVQVILGQESLNFKDKNYSCFWNLYETRTGSYNIEVTDWNKDLPCNVASKKSLLPFKTPLERTCKGSRDLTISFPGVPKTITYNQKQTAYFISETLTALHLDVTLAQKIPYGDAFKTRTCFIIKNLGNNGVSIEFKYYFEWFYSTMMKKMLIKGATDEIMSSKPTFEKLIAELKEEGIFDQKRTELEVLNQEELSSDEGEGETLLDLDNDEEDEPSIEDQGRQSQIQDSKPELETSISKFKVSKRVLFVYFSLVIVFMNYLFFKVRPESTI